jgi:hypothetical protein
MSSEAVPRNRFRNSEVRLESTSGPRGCVKARWDDGVVGTKPSDRVEAFFDDLCVTFGWCLSASQRQAVLDRGGDGLEAFVVGVVEVYTATDAAYCDRHARQRVIDLANKWLFDSGGAGAWSGLS